MDRYVDIEFDCIPLRSVGRFDVPLDASPDDRALWQRVRQGAEKHGLHNSYYLCNARCVFHLTNAAEMGMLEFEFEGTALTDPDDQKTLRCDLSVRLRREVCPWLTAAAAQWFGETVREAVRIEFDRYITAGDLAKTVARVERLQAETDARGGFVGMGL